MASDDTDQLGTFISEFLAASCSGHATPGALPDDKVRNAYRKI